MVAQNTPKRCYIIMKKVIHAVISCCLICVTFTHVGAQNKSIEKGKETLEKAFSQKDPQKRQAMIQKADALLTEGGLRREKNLIIGDAFLDHGELVQAASYFSRCDKKEKADGLKRVGDAYVRLAFGEEVGDSDETLAGAIIRQRGGEGEKAEAKLLKSAVKYYTQSNSLRIGAKGIGDRYYNRGKEHFDKALEYYFVATDTPSAEKVVNTMIRDGEPYDRVLDVLKQINSKNTLKKAGDLCFERNDYEKALDYYSQISHNAGMRKCAEKFNELGKREEAQSVYVRMADNYMKTANTEAVSKLAIDNVNAMNYELAAKIYDKAGNLFLANKYYAYHKFMVLDLDSAKLLLHQNGEGDLSKAIDVNIKPLNNLRVSELTLQDFVSNQPNVSMENDPATGKLRPSIKDESILIGYYKGIKDAIVGTFHSISRDVLAVNNPTLRKMLIKHFQEYPAGTKILDDSFNIRLQKSTSSVKDVYLK